MKTKIRLLLLVIQLFALMLFTQAQNKNHTGKQDSLAKNKTEIYRQKLVELEKIRKEG